jgi:hypothetical protein
MDRIGGMELQIRARFIAEMVAGAVSPRRNGKPAGDQANRNDQDKL